MASSRHPLLDPTRDEELRLALVMNGGVSLAVWMGGVSFEINRFIGETHPVYEGLLALTRTRARVDVICGASAGGINGAALAMGHVYDKSLYALRDIWLNTGSFGKLLRDPGKSNPRSLLDGDGTFLPALEAAFEKLAEKRSHPFALPSDLPIDLSLTATLLEGERRELPDDLGSVVEDLVHRKRFHFVRKDNADPFENPVKLAKLLAKAARTSASFPVAFEPSLCDPRLLDNSLEITKTKYLIDGGVLDNKPLDLALEAIKSLKAEGNVRRVLGYIVPDPAVGSERPADESPPKMLSLGEIAVKSLITIPSAQSISTQLEAIRAHNADLPKRRRTLATIVAHTRPKALEEMAVALFETYRHRRIDGLIDFVLEQLAAAQGPANLEGSLGANTRRWLRALLVHQVAGTAIWDGFVPSGPHDLDVAFATEERWSWGLYSIEALASIMLDLLRRTQRLHHFVETSAPVLPEPRAGKTREENWERYDSILRDRRQSASAAYRDDLAPTDSQLPGLWKRAFEQQAVITKRREAGNKWRREYGIDVLTTLRFAGLDEPGSEDVARRVINKIIAWVRQYDDAQARVDAKEGSAARRPEAGLADLASKVGRIIADLEPVVKSVLESPRAQVPGGMREDDALAVSELRALHDYVYLNGSDSDAIVRQLLILEVLQYATSHRSTESDIPLELVQISARQQSPWGGPGTPSKKLAGMQVGHFGAFYKKSWRASDWMIGRLDGIDRLIHIGINPDRLHRLYGGRSMNVAGRSVPASDWVRDRLYALAVTDAAPEHRSLLEENWDETGVLNELRFLDAANARVPDGLPHACEAVIRRLELEVLCSELPMLADAVSDDLVSGASDNTAGAELERRFPKSHRTKGHAALPAEKIVELFSTYGIGAERFTKEGGTDLFTRTIGHTVAVTHSAASGSGGGLGPLRALLKSIKLPVFVFYMLTDRLQNDSRTAAAVTTAILVAGISAVVASSMVSTNAAVIATFGWTLIAGWSAAALLRGRWAFFFGSAVIVTLITSGHPEKLIAAAVALGLLLALYKLPPLGSAVILTLAAMWWTTGHPTRAQIAAAVCDDIPRAPWCVAGADAANAGVFVSLSKLLLLLVVVAWLAQLVGRRRSR